jgi:hypothetical protein
LLWCTDEASRAAAPAVVALQESNLSKLILFGAGHLHICGVRFQALPLTITWTDRIRTSAMSVSRRATPSRPMATRWSVMSDSAEAATTSAVRRLPGRCSTLC